jgi:hypothetical protein
MEGRNFLEKKNQTLNTWVERGDSNQYITFFSLKILCKKLFKVLIMLDINFLPSYLNYLYQVIVI